LIADPVGVGSGFGDPLDRAPSLVLRDFIDSAISLRLADAVYGVVLVPGDEPHVDEQATAERRAEVRSERLAGASPVHGAAPVVRIDRSGMALRRFHAYVEIARLGDGSLASRCVKCAHVYGPANENYKFGAVRRIVAPNHWSGTPLPDGSPYLAEMHEYFCPGCGTQIDIEVHCPSMEPDQEPIWDTRLALDGLAGTSGPEALRAAEFAATR
jgi:hypothetical protein